MLLTSINSCTGCGQPIRTVETTNREVIIINVDPDPEGEYVPWPSDRIGGPAMARHIWPPIPGDTRWSRHTCPVN